MSIDFIIVIRKDLVLIHVNKVDVLWRLLALSSVVDKSVAVNVDTLHEVSHLFLSPKFRRSLVSLKDLVTLLPSTLYSCSSCTHKTNVISYLFIILLKHEWIRFKHCKLIDVATILVLIVTLW